MTYWPISSPSVFAATKSTNVERSHDGTDRASQNGQDDASEAESTDGTDDDTSVASSEESTSVRTEQEAQQTGVPEQFAEEDEHGEIIAIRVTRSGQLFATLTQSTLTIWQTKVCSLLAYSGSTNYNPAHRYPSFSLALTAVT
jgi:hypothetical protein